jgi:hypothetical protein
MGGKSARLSALALNYRVAIPAINHACAEACLEISYMLLSQPFETAPFL